MWWYQRRLLRERQEELGEEPETAPIDDQPTMDAEDEEVTDVYEILDGEKDI